MKIEGWKEPVPLKVEEGAAAKSEKDAEPAPIKGMAEIKGSIHRKLLERLNLANLESVSRDEPRTRSGT
jgi:hypothetical protein